MNPDTKFLLQRIDEVEQRLSKKIDVLWDFRLKILGASVVVSCIVGSAIHALIHFLDRS